MDRLLGDVLERVLGFTINQDLLTQVTTTSTGKRPDYIPEDTRLHPFVFDAKGTDTTDLGQHYDQLAGYMRSKGLSYGVLSNLRDLAVYTPHSHHPEADLSFSFYRLYQEYKADPDAALHGANAKHFLAFVERFGRQSLDQGGKVEAIISARHGPIDAELDPDYLVQRLHGIVASLHDDVRRQRAELTDRLRYNEKRLQSIALEIGAIAHDIDANVPEAAELEIEADMPSGNAPTTTLERLLEASQDTVDGQATDRYSYQVAYFAMTRLLLVRVWEDIGFVDETLYDGGFKQWYEHYNKQIKRVLDLAFHYARGRYSWLYGADNNYTWYTPSDDVLIDVLYDFSRFNFKRLTDDVLGAVYEGYLDRTDRKNKGQYYTPRSVIRFIWDRVGFTDWTGIFRFEAGKTVPRTCDDFCTGSGGFLVEAARRIRVQVLGADTDAGDMERLRGISMDDLTLAMSAIIEGLRGCEISAFAYYLTEVNLLIQLTPIIAAIQAKDPGAISLGQDYSLSVINQDSLKLHNKEQHSLLGLPEDLKPSYEVYEQDRRRDIANLSGYKKHVYHAIKDDEEVDYACSNPPYVGEAHHKDLFNAVKRNVPYWAQYYQGKMDYLYWFIILGLSKLRDGGKLGYITTGYWPTAEGAGKLRQYILMRAKIVEMIDFGDVRLFPDAPGQHNIVFVLERCVDAATRTANRPLMVKVKREGDGETHDERLSMLLDRIRDLASIGDGEVEDEYVRVFRSAQTQGGLTQGAWSLGYGDVEGAIIHQMESVGVHLSGVLEINAGVHSNADAVKEDDLKQFTVDQLAKSGAKAGQGIFVLTAQEVEDLRLTPAERAVVKPTYKNSDISPYVVSPDEDAYLLYVDNAFDPGKHPRIMAHLKRYRPILQGRLDRYEESYPWYRLHRPHNSGHYEAEKIVAPRWGKRIDFALEPGGRYENSDINVFIKKDGVREDIKYILALLNSRPVRFWKEHKGEFRGVSRQALLQRIPLRRIRFKRLTDDARKEQLQHGLALALADRNGGLAYRELADALARGEEDAVHDAMVVLVDEIIARMTTLVGYDRYFGTRLTRLEDNDPLLDIEPLAVVQGLPPADLRDLDTCIRGATLELIESFFIERDEFYVSRIKRTDDTSVVLRGKSRGAGTITLSGDATLIGYLSGALAANKDRFWRDVKSTLVPRDIEIYRRETARIIRDVSNIRADIAARRYAIDQIVLDLYDIRDTASRDVVLSDENESQAAIGNVPAAS